MKKIILCALSIAALALVSCNKETPEVQPEAANFLSFKAYIAEGDITKTAYANEKTFSWVGDECLSMQLIRKSDNKRDRWLFYNETVAGGSTANFKSSGSLSTETWGLGEYAFYPFPGNANCPDHAKSFNVGSVRTNNTEKGYEVVYNTFYSSVSNPLQLVPMIGYKDADDNFAFHTATGILKVTVSNIDSRLAKVRLLTNGQKLKGNFEMTGDGNAAYVAMTTTTTDGEKYLDVVYTDRTTETELPFYFPVPVGTLDSGFQVILLDGSDNVIKAVTAPVDVVIERNKISEITKAIVLPAEDFSATVTPAGTSLAIKANVDITKDATSVKVVLATTEAAGLSLIDSDDASVVTFTADGEVVLPMTNVTASGTACLVYKTYGGAEAKLSGSVPAYVITSTDAASICAKYVRDARTGSTSLIDLDPHGDNTITLEVSDNPAKGNIMITEFAGFTNIVANHTFTTWSRAWDSFTDGDPVYGLYGDSIVYGGNTGAEFYNVNEQIFYTDNSSSKHIIGTEQGAVSTLKFAFNSDAYSTGTVHDLVVWNPYIGNNWNASLTSYDFYFSQYVAYKTKGMVALTKDMLSTNSSYGEDGSGDRGGMAALVDKSSSTYWHSNYGGSVDTDEFGVYIQIDLTSISKTVNDFTIKFMSRNSTHGLPTKYRIAVSQDGTNWSFVTEETSITAGAKKWYQQSVNDGNAYCYVRLCITESDRGALTTVANGSYYTHMAEVQIWEN